MNPKVAYNPDITTGQLYYIDGDTMLAFEYEYHKRNGNSVLMINLPLHYDNDIDPESEQQFILNYIGIEVARRQAQPSYYEVGSSAISIHRIHTFPRIKRWQIEGIVGLLMIAMGIFMIKNGIIYGQNPTGPILYPKRNFYPLLGECILMFAVIILIDAYFKRRTSLKKQLQQQKLLSGINKQNGSKYGTTKEWTRD